MEPGEPVPSGTCPKCACLTRISKGATFGVDQATGPSKSMIVDGHMNNGQLVIDTVCESIPDDKVTVLAAKEWETLGSERRRFVLSCGHILFLSSHHTEVGDKINCPLCLKKIVEVRKREEGSYKQGQYPIGYELSCGHTLLGKLNDYVLYEMVECMFCQRNSV
jgi:hypothetical protein